MPVSRYSIAFHVTKVAYLVILDNKNHCRKLVLLLKTHPIAHKRRKSAPPDRPLAEEFPFPESLGGKETAARRPQPSPARPDRSNTHAKYFSPEVRGGLLGGRPSTTGGAGTSFRTAEYRTRTSELRTLRSTHCAFAREEIFGDSAEQEEVDGQDFVSSSCQSMLIHVYDFSVFSSFSMHSVSDAGIPCIHVRCSS
jgi:hypothetical protein